MYQISWGLGPPVRLQREIPETGVLYVRYGYDTLNVGGAGHTHTVS